MSKKSKKVTLTVIVPNSSFCTGMTAYGQVTECQYFDSREGLLWCGLGFRPGEETGKHILKDQKCNELSEVQDVWQTN